MGDRDSIAVKAARAYSVSLPQVDSSPLRESLSSTTSLATRKRTKVMLKLYRNYLLHVSLVAGINLHRIVKVKKGFLFLLTNQLTAYKLWTDRIAVRSRFATKILFS
jgi:hypothetical protein